MLSVLDIICGSWLWAGRDGMKLSVWLQSSKFTSDDADGLSCRTLASQYSELQLTLKMIISIILRS